MNHWWVNHKQTFKEELEGGYIWSPQQNANGSFNQTYENLKLVRSGDWIYSYSNTQIKAIGVIENECQHIPKPTEFNSKANSWSDAGYLVTVNWTTLSDPLYPKLVINEIKSLLPPKYSPLQDNGKGNQGCYLASISPELSARLLQLISQNNSTALDIFNELGVEVKEATAVQQILQSPLPQTQKEQLIKARIGQGTFKNRVISIEKKCRITGITDSRFLIASHIKPWIECNDIERLDGNNGLLLSPHVDKLFDKGWITFSDTGKILVANQVAQNVMQQWNIPLENVGEFNPAQKKYLKYHQENIYIK